MSEPFTLYKLIILYMLSKVNFSLSNSQITDFILDKEYTDYLTLQQALAELLEVKLIRVDASSKNSLYNITEEGMETLGFFENRISEQIKEDITSYIKSHGYELYNELSILADFEKNSDNCNGSDGKGHTGNKQATQTGKEPPHGQAVAVSFAVARQ